MLYASALMSLMIAIDIKKILKCKGLEFGLDADFIERPKGTLNVIFNKVYFR